MSAAKPERPLRPAAAAVDHPRDEDEADGEAHPVGDRRGMADAGGPQMQAEHEPQVEHDVDQAEDAGDHQRRAGAPEADQPAGQREHRQRSRRSQRPSRQIGGALDVDRGLALQDGKADRGDRPAQAGDNDAEDDGDGERPYQDALHLAFLAGTGRLRHQPGRAHAQEVEAPQEDIDDDAAERDAAEVGGIARQAEHEGIDGGGQRHRGIGEDQRPGAAQDLKAREGFGRHCGKKRIESSE